MRTEKKRIVDVLLENHQGAENAIKSRLLAHKTGINERILRAKIKDLIEQDHVPIGSTTEKPWGYYIITDDAERRKVLGSLYRRAISTLNRAKAYDYDHSPWVSTMIGQLELLGICKEKNKTSPQF